MIDAERWQRAHNSAQDALSVMDGEFFVFVLLSFGRFVFCSECCLAL